MAMQTSWHVFWNAVGPYVLTLSGLAFLVLIARQALKGVTGTRYSKVHRTNSPISFWFFLALNILLGCCLLLGGVAWLFGG